MGKLSHRNPIKSNLKNLPNSDVLRTSSGLRKRGFFLEGNPRFPNRPKDTRGRIRRDSTSQVGMSWTGTPGSSAHTWGRSNGMVNSTGRCRSPATLDEAPPVSLDTELG